MEAVKDVNNMGFTVKRKDALDTARRLIDALKEADRGCIGLWTFQLMELISKERVSANRMRYFQETADESVEPMEQYLKENLSRRITLESMEREFNCSKSTIINRFIRRCQYTSMKYLANLRMMEAERLLIESDAAMTHIAESVGYDNPSNFARAFKQFTGMSPREYRKCYGRPENNAKK